MEVLQGRYRVRRIDKYNLIVEERKKGGEPLPFKKDGLTRPGWKRRGFFGRLDHAFSYIISHTTLEECKELSDVVAHIDQVKEALQEVEV